MTDKSSRDTMKSMGINFVLSVKNVMGKGDIVQLGKSKSSRGIVPNVQVTRTKKLPSGEEIKQIDLYHSRKTGELTLQDFCVSEFNPDNLSDPITYDDLQSILSELVLG